MGRASPNKTNSYAAKPKGLWLYTGDKRIGNYKSSDEWVAVPISTVARENGTGFASIIDAVKKYYDSIGMKRILKLAFVVHGDVGGVVQIYNNEKNIPKDIPTSEIEKYYNFMSPYTIFYFLEEIAKLNQYITKDAQVIFYSCMAGNGSEGSYLLEKISAKIPGKTVIAFTTLGESGVSYSGALKLKPAGIVYETGETRSYDHTKIYPVRKIDSKYSKHARDGKVITPAKLPPIEKNLPFFRPERIIYIKKNFFDFLLYDKHLYYLGIMLIALAWLCWILIPVFAMSGISILQFSAITAFLLISSEVLNVFGTIFIGKQLWDKFSISKKIKKLFRKK